MERIVNKQAAATMPPRKRFRKGYISLYILLGIFALLHLFPILWMLLSSLRPQEEVIKFPIVFLPSRLTLENFISVFIEFSFARYFSNSLFLSTTITALNLFTCCLVGYVFAKFEFKGKNLIFLGLLATMMIPFPVRMIPNYQIMVWFKWIDSYSAIIVPQLFITFGIFFLRQYIFSIPNDLLDAARIDAAGEFGIFFRIIVPLVKPAIATIGILRFISVWDQLLWPLIVLNNTKKFTLPVGLAMFHREHYTLWGAVMAGSVVTVIPTLIVFLILQRYFIENITLSGLKG